MEAWLWGQHADRDLRSGVKVFPEESSALQRQHWRCLWMLLPCWVPRCGYPLHARALSETRDLCGLDNGDAMRRYPLGASSWSFGSPRSCSSVFGGKSWFLLYILFIFDLLYKSFSSSPYIGSVVVDLFIKLD
jgi:hypothetical protein